MAAKPKSIAMCCVTIGHQRILLPADAGMKVVALMRDARELAYDFDSDHRHGYIVGEPMDVEFVTVRANQLRAPREQPSPPEDTPRIGKPQLLLGRSR